MHIPFGPGLPANSCRSGRSRRILWGATALGWIVALALIPMPAPAQTATPSTDGLIFATQPTGSTSAAQAITITNTGSAKLSIASVTLGGANAPSFGIGNTCGTPLAGGASCAVSVTFAPLSAGPKSATVTINSNGTIGSLTLSLSGTSNAATAGLTVSPTSLVLPSQPAGTSGIPQILTVTNTTTATVALNAFTFTGPNVPSFGQANYNCFGSLAPGGQCTFGVSFIPPSAGSKSASLTITSSASNGTNLIPLSGTATGPAATLAIYPATSVPFGDQVVATHSAVQVLYLYNDGSGPLDVSSITLSGANAAFFATSNTCGAPVGVNGECTISVTFTPL